MDRDRVECPIGTANYTRSREVIERAENMDPSVEDRYHPNLSGDHSQHLEKTFSHVTSNLQTHTSMQTFNQQRYTSGLPVGSVTPRYPLSFPQTMGEQPPKSSGSVEGYLYNQSSYADLPSNLHVTQDPRYPDQQSYPSPTTTSRQQRLSQSAATLRTFPSSTSGQSQYSHLSTSSHPYVPPYSQSHLGGSHYTENMPYPTAPSEQSHLVNGFDGIQLRRGFQISETFLNVPHSNDTTFAINDRSSFRHPHSPSSIPMSNITSVRQSGGVASHATASGLQPVPPTDSLWSRHSFESIRQSIAGPPNNSPTLSSSRTTATRKSATRNRTNQMQDIPPHRRLSLQEVSIQGQNLDQHMGTYLTNQPFDSPLSTHTSLHSESPRGPSDTDSPRPPDDSADFPEQIPLLPDGEDPAPPPNRRKKLSKQHHCPICNKPFPRPSGLRTHMNVHDNKKPFMCEFTGCQRAFGVRSNAKRHLRTHGVDPGSLPAASEQPYIVGFKPHLIDSDEVDLPQAVQDNRPPYKLRWMTPNLSATTNTGLLLEGSRRNSTQDNSSEDEMDLAPADHSEVRNKQLGEHDANA